MKWVARLAVGLVMAGLILAAVGCGGGGGPAADLTAGQRLSAMEAWEVIEPDALRWKPESLIVAARPPSRPGREDLDTDGRSSAWRFIVAPAGDGSPAFFSIDTTQSPIRPNRSDQIRPAAPANVDPATWTIDSPAAFEIALANGFQDFITDHPDFVVRTMTLELSASVENGAFWTLEGRSGSDSYRIMINAVDGTIISVSE
jgi:hypothetical protein